MINSVEFIIIIIMTWMGALGGLFLKKSTNIKIKINKYLFFGGFCYCFGALLNIILLKYIPLTIVFPCNSLTYIWTTLLGRFVFKETITKFNIIGLILITCGSFCLIL